MYQLITEPSLHRVVPSPQHLPFVSLLQQHIRREGTFFLACTGTVGENDQCNYSRSQSAAIWLLLDLTHWRLTPSCWPGKATKLYMFRWVRICVYVCMCFFFLPQPILYYHLPLGGFLSWIMQAESAAAAPHHHRHAPHHHHHDQGSSSRGKQQVATRSNAKKWHWENRKTVWHWFYANWWN